MHGILVSLIALTAPMANQENDDELELLLILPPPPEFAQAPEMPRIVDGLPHPSLELDKICYPLKTHDALGQWILYAAKYPSEICQQVVDTAVVGCKMWADNQQAELDAYHRQELAEIQIEHAGEWPLWAVIGSTIGAFVLGGLGGYLVGNRLAR